MSIIVKNEINDLSNYFKNKLICHILQYDKSPDEELEISKDFEDFLKLSNLSEIEIIKNVELRSRSINIHTNNVFSYVAEYANNLSAIIAKEIIKKYGLICSPDHIKILIDYAGMKYFSSMEYKNFISGADKIINMAIKEKVNEAVRIWSDIILPALDHIDQLVGLRDKHTLDDYPEFIAYLLYNLILIIYEFKNNYN